MDKQRFCEYLEERGLTQEQIDESVEVLAKFETFLNAPDRGGCLDLAGREDVNAFSEKLIEEELNTWDRFVALIRYGRFIRNDSMSVAALDLIDGAEALENLHSKLAEAIGAEERDKIFEGIELPPLGTPNDSKPLLTQTVLTRMQESVAPNVCKRVLGSGLRHLEDEGYLDSKKKYEESGTVDAYLERKGKDFIAELESIRDEGRLFFTQPITDAVIDYVRQHPEIEAGVRVGNVVYEAKIPHQAAAYLDATDPQARAYHYCHCPWVKGSLKDGQSEIPSMFCNCSAAFHKKSWEVIFGRTLQAEVVESILQGDPWCKFAIHLPEEVL